MTKTLATAFRAQKAADSIALKYWRKNIAIQTKQNWRDLVTRADIECDKAIREVITKTFPSHSIFSEELGRGSEKNAEWLWVIDPIDGTVNYTMGEPMFGISIALLHNNQPYLGVVSMPALQELYWAEAGSGAWRTQNVGNDRGKKLRCKVSSVTRMKQSMFSIGFTATNASRNKYKRIANPLLMSTKGMRVNYCAVFDLMNVARGGMDFYINLDINLWDFAAGWCIVQEAGGELIDPKGNPATTTTRDVIATNGKITKPLIRNVKI